MAEALDAHLISLSDEAGQEGNISFECPVCGKPEQAAYSPCCSMNCWSQQFEEPKSTNQ